MGRYKEGQGGIEDRYGCMQESRRGLGRIRKEKGGVRDRKER